MSIDWVQLAGAVLGIANIVLLVRRSVWNFPVAMVMVTLIGVVMVRERLYAEAGLQAFFFVVNGWGWWLWRRAAGDAEEIPVDWMGRQARLAWGAVTIVLSLSLGWLLHRFTNATLPFADSAVAGASVTAQILLSLRRVENWVVWIAIDVASVALYVNRGLFFLAALYVAFGVLSWQGLRQWRAAAR